MFVSPQYSYVEVLISPLCDPRLDPEPGKKKKGRIGIIEVTSDI